MVRRAGEDTRSYEVMGYPSVPGARLHVAADRLKSFLLLPAEFSVARAKSAKNADFFDRIYKSHNFDRGSLVNIALAPRPLIGYNMVTKVTTRCFWLS